MGFPTVKRTLAPASNRQVVVVERSKDGTLRVRQAEVPAD
jgi:hypothetical protein